jgi:hypothetical protein
MPTWRTPAGASRGPDGPGESRSGRPCQAKTSWLESGDRHRPYSPPLLLSSSPPPPHLLFLPLILAQFRFSNKASTLKYFEVQNSIQFTSLYFTSFYCLFVLVQARTSSSISGSIPNRITSALSRAAPSAALRRKYAVECSFALVNSTITLESARSP